MPSLLTRSRFLRRALRAACAGFALYCASAAWGQALTGLSLTSDAGSDGAYKVDDLVEVTASFDVDVVVDGNPAVRLLIGKEERSAVYWSGQGRELQFRYTVVEGNRRLAALKILHGAPEAGNLHFPGIEPSPEQIERLGEVPCFFISNRDEIHAYIGFRHIGGLKTWPPEAKARFLFPEVRKLVDAGAADPFRELGRRFGSNTQAVRNPYLAIRILLYARDEFGLDVTYVQKRRFGVWLRCMNSADIRTYIGLGPARTYREIEEALGRIDRDRLAEVLGDLQSKGGRAQAVLGDSRDVTTYGRALADKRARATLRATGDLSLARQVVDELELEPRAQRLVKSLELFLETLSRAETADFSNGLLQATEELSRLSRSSRAIVKDRMDDHDQES